MNLKVKVVITLLLVLVCVSACSSGLSDGTIKSIVVQDNQYADSESQVTVTKKKSCKVSENEEWNDITEKWLVEYKAPDRVSSRHTYTRFFYKKDGKWRKEAVGLFDRCD